MPVESGIFVASLPCMPHITEQLDVSLACMCMQRQVATNEGEMASLMAVVNISSLKSLAGLRAHVFPHLYAEVVAQGSTAYEEVRHFQAERLAALSRTASQSPDQYVEATDYDPHGTIPLVVRRTHPLLGVDGPSPLSSPGMSGQHPDELIAATRLELHGATLIEKLIQFLPGSQDELLFEKGQVFEVGGFATKPDTDKFTLIEVLDTMVALTLNVMERLDATRLWIFPRNGFMTLLRAYIPDILPPYHFVHSHGMASWKEGDQHLERFRALRPKGLRRYPHIYEIDRPQLAADLEQRLQVRPALTQYRDNMDRLWRRATFDAQRVLVDEESMWELPTVPTTSSEPERASFLPFGGSAKAEGDYLQSVVARGGASAAHYKSHSLDLLQLHNGHRVLDVGCGAGIDLSPLYERVGNNGIVVGLERDQELATRARANAVVREHGNVLVFCGDGARMTFPNEMFDRVRTDRVLQHVPQPERVLQEMWRVLRPGGRLAVVEPDWRMVAIYPGSAQGGSDTHVVDHLLATVQQELAQPVIGRQLWSLLHLEGGPHWSDVHIEVGSYVVHDWATVDVLLRLSNTLAELERRHDPMLEEARGWLSWMRAGGANGFLAVIPLVFASAQKPANTLKEAD